MLHEAMLPPKSGYVEVEVDGKRTYRNADTGALIDDEPSPTISEQRVVELKDKLRETDYQAIKYAEGWITAEDYEPIKTQRQAWRDEINTLEMEAGA